MALSLELLPVAVSDCHVLCCPDFPLDYLPSDRLTTSILLYNKKASRLAIDIPRLFARWDISFQLHGADLY